MCDKNRGKEGMVMKRIIACIVAAALVLAAIGALHFNAEKSPEDAILLDDEQSAQAVEEQALFDELFDINSTVDISVNISREQLAKIQEDYTYYSAIGGHSTAYRIADSVTFTVNGKKYVIRDVGLRMKGSSSRSNYYNDILGIYNLVHFKMSFNETFDDNEDYGLDTRSWSSPEERQKRQNRTFATMKGLELKWNITADNTYVRNIYANELFRDYGIPVQRCHLATYSMGGCKMGIYRMFEPVNEDFIHRYFPPEDWGGDLYKVRCTDATPASYLLSNTYGICDKKKGVFYNFDLKTNKDTSGHESLRRLLEVINRPDATREELDSVADTDELALFNAVNFITGNQDDLRNNYNNHFLYFRKSDGKAVFIPYDCEVCLGDTYVSAELGESLTELSPYYEYISRYGAVQEHPLVRQTVLRGGYYTDQYTAYLRDIAGSKWMTEAHYRTFYDPVAAHYSDKVLSRYHFFSTFNKNMAFSMEGGEAYNGNQSVGEFMDDMRQNIEQYTR